MTESGKKEVQLYDALASKEPIVVRNTPSNKIRFE